MRIYNENLRPHTHFTEVTSLDGFCSNATALSGPFRKEFLVQVNMQDGIFADVGTGGAINLNIDWGTFDKALIMQKVAQFYCDYDCGAGIDLYWVNRPFVPLEGPPIEYGNGSARERANAYRYTGDMVYFPKQGATVTGDLNGSTWISSDTEYKATVPSTTYQELFPPAHGMFRFMMEQNRDDKLSGFVLLLLTSRYSEIARENNYAPYKTYPKDSNAFAILSLQAPDVPHQRGAVVNIAGIAEERPFNPNITTGLGHYSSAEFLDVIGYCIAHELFHLLGGFDLVSLNGISGVFLPLNQITISSAELQQINLKSKQGVTQ